MKFGIKGEVGSKNRLVKASNNPSIRIAEIQSQGHEQVERISTAIDANISTS